MGFLQVYTQFPSSANFTVLPRIKLILAKPRNNRKGLADLVIRIHLYFSVEKVDRSSDDYDNWCNDVAETKKIIEKQQQEVEASSTPTSDPEERKKHIVTITVSRLLIQIVRLAFKGSSSSRMLGSEWRNLVTRSIASVFCEIVDSI